MPKVGKCIDIKKINRNQNNPGYTKCATVSLFFRFENLASLFIGLCLFSAVQHQWPPPMGIGQFFQGVGSCIFIHVCVNGFNHVSSEELKVEIRGWPKFFSPSSECHVYIVAQIQSGRNETRTRICCTVLLWGEIFL